MTISWLLIFTEVIDAVASIDKILSGYVAAMVLYPFITRSKNDRSLDSNRSLPDRLDCRFSLISSGISKNNVRSGIVFPTARLITDCTRLRSRPRPCP